MTIIDHISLLHIKDKKILLVISNGKTTWALPGGKRDVNETDEESLIRECKEELSINIKRDTIKHFETLKGIAYEKPQDTIIEVKIYTAQFEGSIKPNAEIEDARYFKFTELPNTSKLGTQFLLKLKDQGFIE